MAAISTDNFSLRNKVFHVWDPQFEDLHLRHGPPKHTSESQRSLCPWNPWCYNELRNRLTQTHCGYLSRHSIQTQTETSSLSLKEAYFLILKAKTFNTYLGVNCNLHQTPEKPTGAIIVLSLCPTPGHWCLCEKFVHMYGWPGVVVAAKGHTPWSPGSVACVPGSNRTVAKKKQTVTGYLHPRTQGSMWREQTETPITQSSPERGIIAYHVWNESPVQVGCTILDAWGWCTGTTQREGMGREEGGGFRMVNTDIPVADSFRYLAKLIQYCKV